MTTLMAAYNSDGCTGRCDARCYNATGPHCRCICQGNNHGAGLKRAMEFTAAHAQHCVADWTATHPDTTIQLPLFTKG